MAGDTGSVGIGARLRAAREKRGQTVLQAAEKLHVDARVLEFLEAENFAPLGADVYVRGHLRRYAELIGESPAQLQDIYASAAPTGLPPDLTRIPRSRTGFAYASLVMPALLVVGALALAVALWWLLSRPGAKPQLVAHSVPAAVTEPAPAALPSGAPAPAPASRRAAADASAVQLDMRFNAASWAQVRDAKGHVLLDGLVPAGAVRTLSGAAPLRVVLGNAAGVALELDGHTLALGGLVRRRGDAHVLVAADGAVSPALPSPGA
ncbi:MAG: DUF4115 domain-containing protein [Gammaproteobacteria bacterium]|nr:DUF4115 domain-containing protein [Gammaproteobacteria bacterium]MBV9696401.1 DUF4115 domain-containing protein [Gammaproteobacteria bacterium]